MCIRDSDRGGDRTAYWSLVTTDSTCEVRAALLAKGVAMPDPASVYVAGDVDPDRVSGDGVTIHSGGRISGSATDISDGVSLGAEGPVTITNVRLGVGASIASGYACLIYTSRWG